MTIKYRAWIEEYQELLPVLLIDYVNGVFYVMPYAELEGGNQVPIENRMELLEQFTGLKDTIRTEEFPEGKEIYYSDIIKYYGYEVRNGKQIRPEKRMVVKDFIYDTLRLRNAIDAQEKIEVIGNMHENPELLK